MTTKRVRLFFLLIVGLIVLNGFLLHIVMQNKKKLSQSQAKLVTLQSQLREQDILLQQYTDLEGYIHQVSQSLPENFSQFATFTQELSTIASQSGQKITLASEDKPKEEKHSFGTEKIVPVTIELNGTYPSLVDYLSKLNQIPYYFEITEFLIEAKATGVNTTIKLNLFVR